MGLFDLLGKKPADVARALDRSDPMAPSAPLVPESSVGIHQVEKVGGLQWQMRQLREGEQRLDEKAARMGARARLHVARSIARGEGQFGVSANPQARTTDGGEFQQMQANMAPEYTTEEADRKLLGGLPGGLPLEMAKYRKRDAGLVAGAPERITEEERLARVDRMNRPRPVQVVIPGFVLDLAVDPENVILNYLAEAGADLEAPHERRIYKNPGNFDLTVTYIPEGFHATSEPAAAQGNAGSSSEPEGRQETGNPQEGGEGI